MLKYKIKINWIKRKKKKEKILILFIFSEKKNRIF